MCKHKSGGMSKPSGASSQDGHSERTTASISSQDCPQSTSMTSNCQVSSSPMVSNAEAAYSSQMRKYTAAGSAASAHPPDCSRSCDTYIFLPNSEPTSDLKQYKNVSLMPNVQENQQDVLESQDSDEDTEQSPMLIHHPSNYCSADTWNMMSKEEPSENVPKPNRFADEDAQHSPMIGHHPSSYCSADTWNNVLSKEEPSKNILRPNRFADEDSEQPPMIGHHPSSYCNVGVWNTNVLSKEESSENVPRPNHFADEDTEQSPMLLHQLSNYCSADTWNNMLSTEEPSKSVPRPNHFNSCDPYFCPKVDRRNKFANCDNFPLYHNLQPPPRSFQEAAPYVPVRYHGACPSYYESTINNFDEMGERSYAMTHKKKWLLNQKCKSADSEPESFSGHLSSVCKQGISPVNYNYVQGQSTNILDTHANARNNYFKPMYVNVNNGDPIAGPSGLQRPCSINWEIGASNSDSEFRSRSYSLTPTVNFAVFELESSSEAEDVQEPMVPEPIDTPTNIEVNTKTMDDPFELPVLSLGKVIPISPSAAQLSIASSYGDNGSPICKICHMTARENDPLISPCRCSGTMQYIHCGCLMRWLEVCHKRGRRPASCELCQYQYHWHKKFKIRHWQFPQCSRKDKVLHLLFIFSVLLMVTCASLTIMFFKQDKGTKVDLNQELTQSEIGNLVCGVLFFVAFFVAIYVEAKSHDTLYKLLVKFIHINQQWYIDEYEKKETAPVAV